LTSATTDIVAINAISNECTRIANYTSNNFKNSFNNPSALSHSTLLLSIAALSIFSKEMLYWYTLKVAQTYQSTMLKANAWHHRSDALSSVVVIAGIFGSLNGYHSYAIRRLDC
jgi:divalent metal cation (Fe/Co/Zn/Cd) transporter